MCGNFSLATNVYSYGYTSYQNLSRIIRFTERIRRVTDFSLFCNRFITYYLCNYVFIPCDLTTGGPRAICSISCYYLHVHCYERYFAALSFVASVGYPVNESCEDTLSHLQLGFGFPCSSSSLQNDCIDILSMWIRVTIYMCVVMTINYMCNACI